MKKLLLLLAFLILTLPAMAHAKNYINGIDPNYPPFAYVDEKTGKPAGFDVDSLDWIAKKMGFTVTHKPLAWDGIIPALNAREIDLICSGMSITQERAKVVKFSNPYWEVYRVFVTKTDSKLTPKDILSKKIDLGVQRGTSEALALKKEQQEKGYPLTFHYYDSAPLAIEDLLNGRIDAAFMDELPADDALSKGRKIKKVGTHGEADHFGVALRKGDQELLKLINDGYKKLMADPYWKELQKKYMNK
ncbi:MAG: amino acid ABC transporter substrate-binding protein [Desulfovibrionaceae bacterium]|nr:amino acid ABC transporter substrate-binding protein [Desulfovibrionaceae bacterium]